VIEWEEARTLVYECGRAASRSTERIELADAAGRTLAHDIRALVALPGYSSSAMDGWAVSGEPPWIVGRPIFAGDSPDEQALAAGTARAIATGGPVPPGTLGILRTEHGRIHSPTTSPVLERNAAARADEPRPGEHVRHTGEEAGLDEVLIATGSLLTPPRIALAAVGGHDLIDVVSSPTVDVALLGTEIINAGIPLPGQVRDAYAPQLPGMLSAMGARFGRMQRVPDELPATIEALSESTAPLLISTGGTARGPADHVRAALDALDCRLLIDGVNMRPGHPVMLAQRPDARLILCLPGNPLAAMMCIASFAAPLIDGMLGRPLAGLGSTRFSVGVDNPGSHTRLVLFGYGPNGAEATEHQRPGMLRGLVDAVGAAIVPPGGVTAEQWVSILSLPW
jgi:molybdopterin molybdotransferase